MTNGTHEDKRGGYENLVAYQLAIIIYDLTVQFCKTFLADRGGGFPTRRTVDQMTQAARSGKQNIVEGSSSRSLSTNIKLSSVARASFGELLEDYRDFLRTNNLSLWPKDDPRVLEIRKMRISSGTNLSNLTNWSHWTNAPESYANLMITLISRENYLLDRLIAALEAKFVREGGYTENLFQKRLRFRSRQFD